MRMPVLYLSHGAPPLADDPIWPGQLAAWSAGLPRPSAILVVSAHSEAAPVTIGATVPAAPPTYDFWGFPAHYYQVTYPQPGANNELTRILIGMHDYGTGIEPASFTVAADFPIDGVKPGQNLAEPLERS